MNTGHRIRRPDIQPGLARRHALLAACGLALLGSGCASLRPASSPQPGWSGRLSLAVRSQPAQTLSAGFELRGNATGGELTLTSPIGTTLAQARWAPEGARLQAGQESHAFASMEDLLRRLTGADLPLAALFDWLQGVPTPAAGWQTDLSQHDSGRVVARRLQPEPQVELRVVLDR